MAVPGHFELDAERLLQLDRQHKLPGFAPLREHAEAGPTIIVRGKGVFVWDVHGKQYLDGIAGIWNVNCGYGQTEIVEAVRAQMDTLAFHLGLMNFSTIPAIELSARLAALAPKGLSRVFLTSGGSEANETVIRLSRFYFRLKGYTHKTTAIALQRGYHGSTSGAAALTGLDHFHERFEPLFPKVRHIDPPYCYRCPYGKQYPSCGIACADELEKVLQEEGTETVAFFIAEPVMGGGGVIVPPLEYFPRIRAICDRYDVLMVADEVITGAGRTGRMFAVEHWGVIPDIISTGKGISSGYLPLGAVLIHEKIYETMLHAPPGTTFWHGFTNVGHPAACAAGLKNLEIVEREGLVERSQKMGHHLLEGLRLFLSSPIVGDVRGLGLMAAVELVRDKESREPFPPEQGVGAFFRQAALAEGLFVRVLGDVIALSPPLVISSHEVDLLIEKMKRALSKTEAWLMKKDR